MLGPLGQLLETLWIIHLNSDQVLSKTSHIPILNLSFFFSISKAWIFLRKTELLRFVVLDICLQCTLVSNPRIVLSCLPPAGSRNCVHTKSFPCTSSSSTWTGGKSKFLIKLHHQQKNLHHHQKPSQTNAQWRKPLTNLNLRILPKWSPLLPFSHFHFLFHWVLLKFL